MCDNIEAFKFKLRLWVNQLHLQNPVHFPHLKSHDFIYPDRIQQYSQSIFFCLKNTRPKFVLFELPSEADIEKAPENLKMELVNSHCDTDLNCKFS
jgi:hypothetical protein